MSLIYFPGQLKPTKHIRLKYKLMELTPEESKLLQKIYDAGPRAQCSKTIYLFLERTRLVSFGFIELDETTANVTHKGIDVLYPVRKRSKAK